MRGDRRSREKKWGKPQQKQNMIYSHFSFARACATRCLLCQARDMTVSLFIIFNCSCDTHEDMKITAFDVSGDQYNPPMPFANLLHLNLANNLIFEEEGLLALMGWPSLRELVLWGNPLTTAFKGDPPILSFQLGRLKGVRIFR